MKSDIKQYVTLRTSLEQERVDLQARLNEIEAALGVSGSAAPPVPQPAKRGLGRPKGSKKTASQSPVVVEETKAPKRKYKRSAAARKKMAEAQRARRAAEQAKEAPATASKPVAKKVPTSTKPKRRTMTPAALKALAKAREIRLAKLKAARAGKK
jgi:hypothetical protein